tara:strand:+ start:249 stop:455 length:207 start_codon:yes stop_codon:yes gene_type:complete
VSLPLRRLTDPPSFRCKLEIDSRVKTLPKKRKETLHKIQRLNAAKKIERLNAAQKNKKKRENLVRNLS